MELPVVAIECFSPQPWLNRFTSPMMMGAPIPKKPPLVNWILLSVDPQGLKNIHIWLVVSNIFEMFHNISGMSSFPLTNSIIFQDG